MNPKKTTTIRYCGQSAAAELQQTLLAVLLEAGFDHRHLCDGRGFCTSCRVQILSGAGNLSAVTSVERERLGSDCGPVRLACQIIVRGPVEVGIPTPRSARFSLVDAED